MNDPLHRRLADALERVAALARARAQSGASAETLSPLQARALVVLRQRGEQRVGDVAEALMVTYGTISAALSSLVDKGLVAKSQDPDEHRAVRVGLTRKGRAAAARAAGWTAAVLEPAVATLAPAEASTLLATLLKLILALERSGALAAARMCVSCRHFAPGAGDARRPHFCHLLRTAIGDADLRVDCPEHARADEAHLRATFAAFDPLA